MFNHGIAAARLFFAVALNAVGLLVLLAAAWLVPHLLGHVVRSGLPIG